MGEHSEIAWTDNTFNPWIGCTKVSQGCVNCYAEALMDKRYGRVKWGPFGLRTRTSADNWKQPMRWSRKAAKEGKRVKVFCSSLADVFEDNDQVKDWRIDLFWMISQTPNLIWLLLTKRPSFALGFFEDHPHLLMPNVWVGFTGERQKEFDERWYYARNLKTDRLFCSIEPMIGDVVLPVDYLRRNVWTIVGGESGANARPMNESWVVSIKNQCEHSNTPFFFKQGSENNWNDFRNFSTFPKWLQVRQFPDDMNPAIPAAPLERATGAVLDPQAD